MTTELSPRTRLVGQCRGRRAPLLAGGAAVLLAGGIAACALLHHPAHSARADLVLHRARYQRLPFAITERGDVESSNNTDICCRVKAGSKGSTVATVIKWVIEDGSEVHGPRPGKPTGDLLVELDESGLVEQLKAQNVVVSQAESDKVQAEEAYKIQVSQNASDLRTAETQVELKTNALAQYTGLGRSELLKADTIARLRVELKGAAGHGGRSAREIAAEDLKQYRTGDYLAALKDSLGQLETAESDLAQQEEREAWALRMVKKGYQTAKQADAETLLKGMYRLAANKTALALDVLVRYTKVQTLTQLTGDVEEARRGLERVTAQARSREIQTRTDRDTKRSIWELALAHRRDIEEEIKKCRIYAPHDGRVLHYIPEQVRSGGSQLSVVAQGEPVREGQRLMQLPDLAHVQVSIRIHEALVTRVHPGQRARIHLDAYPDRVLHGHVQTVATLATPPSWMTGDVQTYLTKVVIDPADIEGLEIHPGLTAQVAITCDGDRPPSLAVPVEALVHDGHIGSEHKMFVMTPDGPEERPVEVGASQAGVAEIKSGLEEGDEVVLNPSALLEDDAKQD
jgi:multidrug resistance efflux pump